MEINWLGIVFAIVVGMAVAFAWYQEGFLGTHGRGLRTILSSDPEQRARGT